MTVATIHNQAMMAAPFHYKTHAFNVMHFLRGAYTGEYWDIDAIVIFLTYHDTDLWLISQYIRATTVRCTDHFITKTSRDNILLHWREGNYVSLVTNMVDLLNTMSKEHRNWYGIPLPPLYYS